MEQAPSGNSPHFDPPWGRRRIFALTDHTTNIPMTNAQQRTKFQNQWPKVERHNWSLAPSDFVGHWSLAIASSPRGPDRSCPSPDLRSFTPGQEVLRRPGFPRHDPLRSRNASAQTTLPLQQGSKQRPSLPLCFTLYPSRPSPALLLNFLLPRASVWRLMASREKCFGKYVILNEYDSRRSTALLRRIAGEIKTEHSTG